MGAEHRKSARRRVEHTVLITSAEGAIIGECTMLDVSASGARLEFATDVAVPDLFILMLSKFDRKLKRHCIVAWRKEKQAGVRFVTAEDFVSAIMASA